MLRGIPEILSPELIKILMKMGHGDEIVIADRNFPSYSKGKRVVRCDGADICTVLEAIIPLFPLDTSLAYNHVLMDVPAELDFIPQVWKKYDKIIKTSIDSYFEPIKLAKPDFYERAANSFAIITTCEKERYANIILRKGIFNCDELS